MPRTFSVDGKNSAIGLRCKIYSLLNSYLNDRQQIVKLDNNIIVPQLTSYGVLQGSLLGPLLFKMYNKIFRM